MSVSHLIFDLGGVIVELKGLPIRNEWTGQQRTAEDTWNDWLMSNAPRAFESGQISGDEFARRIVTELDMSVSAEEYLAYFAQLPVGPYNGAMDLLQKLKKRYVTALFSNSNEIHWQRKMGEMQLSDAFHHHFASHLMGLVKPDAAAFEHVIKILDVAPEQILFFDDNQLNVDAARRSGMQAEHVRGLDALERSLIAHGISIE